MQKIKYLEGLRGFAALIVLFGHLRNTCFITQQAHLNSCISDFTSFDLIKELIINTIRLFLDGELAVWIFWVLSAYVISISFFKRDRNYDKILIGYFSKRYLRLFIPVLASIIFSYLLVKFGFMYNSELAVLLGPPYDNGWLETFYAFEPNLYLALKSAVYETFFHFKFNSSYNAILWTIQNEFLGSLFIFSIFGIIRHNKRRYILYLIISIIILRLQMLWMGAFVAGFILCDYDFMNSDNKILGYFKKLELKIHKIKIPVFIISLLFIILGRNIMTFIHLPSDFQSLILSIFIVYFCLRHSYYQAIFSLKLPVWLGNISFSLYLIHLPIICSLTSFLILTNYSLSGKISASIITIAIVLFLSSFFTKYIDKKGVVYSNRIGDYFKKYS